MAIIRRIDAASTLKLLPRRTPLLNHSSVRQDIHALLQDFQRSSEVKLNGVKELLKQGRMIEVKELARCGGFNDGRRMELSL